MSHSVPLRQLSLESSSGAACPADILDKSLSLRQFCRRLRVAPGTAIRWITDGRIKAFRVGPPGAKNRLRIPTTMLDAMVRPAVLSDKAAA